MKRKVGSDFGSFIAPLLVKRTDSRQAAEQVEAGAGKAAKEAAVARGRVSGQEVDSGSWPAAAR